VALIGDEDEAFAGGSDVFMQRYVHDLAKWAAIRSSPEPAAHLVDTVLPHVPVRQND
jgi:deferrochelatase/peroxidase EfeB